MNRHRGPPAFFATSFSNAFVASHQRRTSVSSAGKSIFVDTGLNIECLRRKQKRPRPPKGRERVHSRGTTLLDGRGRPLCGSDYETPVWITETNPGKSTG